MKHVTTCTCGKVIITSRPQKYCRACYLKKPFPRLNITLKEVLAFGQDKVTIKDTADILEVSYAQLRRVIKRHAIPGFPNRGEGKQIALRGYAL